MDYKDVRGLNSIEIAKLFTKDELREIYSNTVDIDIDEIHYSRLALAYKIYEYIDNGFVHFI